MWDIDRSWHLSETEDEKGITEFELQFWRLFWAFYDWIQTCQKVSTNIPLSGLEVAIIHTIRQNSQPKTLSDLGRKLNRSDSHNLLYSIKKLLKYELIEKIKSPIDSQKNVVFGITEKGLKVTTEYANLRKMALIPLATRNKELNFLEMSEKFIRIKSMYEEAERIATTYVTPATSEDNVELS